MEDTFRGAARYSGVDDDTLFGTTTQQNVTTSAKLCLSGVFLPIPFTVG